MSKEQLFKAIKEKNLQKVNECIEEGVGIDSKDEFGGTALHAAAFYENRDIIEILVEKGAKVNMRDEDGWTPLFHAVIKNNVKCTKLLLKNKADPNIAEGGIGDTPLIVAASKGNKELIELLLKYGAEINAVTESGRTVLHASANNFAYKGGDFENIKLLLEHGAKSYADSFGHTPKDIIGPENPLSQIFDQPLTSNDASSLLGDTE